ncbi:fungal chitosanase of glycosyl hydrolase group 75-domain-containing protein [Mycena vulgaris]|nr:fungal chitosanase of glycosyl hydrolase group 75-domain-containing protein [Mycena vulgaris]
MIWIMRTTFTPLHALVLASVALAAPLTYLKIRHTSSIDYSSFTADPSLNATALYDAAKRATKTKMENSSYLTDPDTNYTTQIYGDWIHLQNVSAFHFMADMDIDCDGVDSSCSANSDVQTETTFGALDASKVPWFVLPQRFADEQKKLLKPNALGAIICDGKIIYAIFGDTNGADPLVIGEGSLLLGQACFQNNTIKIDGNHGHDQRDVAYIVFGQQVPTGIGKNTIDLAALKTLGDQQVRLLAQELNL